MESDRRNFLVKFGGATAAAVTTSALISELSPPAHAQAALKGSPYLMKFGLQLDETFAGWLYSAEGGSAVGQVVEEPGGADAIARKHIGAVKYEDITLTCGDGMSYLFFDWVGGTVNGKRGRKNGAIVAADFNYREMSQRRFVNALVTEIGMPALDAAAKDAAKMTIKLSPEFTRLLRGNPIKWEPPASKQKKWLPANFRLRIDGLDQACARVNKIEALTIKQAVIADEIGALRDYAKEPGKLEFPNLVITLPDTAADELYAWHEDFVIKGNNGQNKERNGSLEYLSTAGETLFKLDFQNLGIFKLAPEPVEPEGENIRRVKAEMYCESMKFSYTPAW